jgi:hypothetical protein
MSDIIKKYMSYKDDKEEDKEEDKEKDKDKKEDKKLLKDDNRVDNKGDNKGDIMKLSDILIPIAISLIIIGLSKYILPEKLFD